MKNRPPLFFGSKIMNLLGFFWILSRNKVFPGPDSMGFVWGGVGRAPLCSFFLSHFLLCSRFWRSDPVVPTLRAASGDVVTGYTY